MSPTSQDYLAAQVLNESRAVNYRLLSRALKVHVNTAKEQLYDFHRTQNARKAGSVHATYLLAGIRKTSPASPEANGVHGKHDGEDMMMSDSFMSSSAPQPSQEATATEIPTTSITLCREEDLKRVQDSYTTLHSIHIYSLEAASIKNLHELSDCNLRLASENTADDAIASWETYGTIRNPKANRRSTRAPPPTKPTPAPAPAKPAAKPEPARPGSSGSTSAKESPAPAPTTAKKAPATKRESSSLFKSFQKAKPRAPTKDAPLTNAPDEGSDTEPLPQASAAESRARADAARQEKQQREQKLQALMDADEPESEPEPDDSDAASADADEEMPDADEPAPAPAPAPQPTEHATTSDGRRRGRRRVLKKKTTRDADGYLVTREESEWEAFSEDEAPPAPAVAAPALKKERSTETASGKTQKGSGAAKRGQGQGNIMSFFGKK